MFGRLFFFLIGVYSGVLANQKYEIPKAPTPSEAWERAQARFEKHKRDRRPPSSEFYDDPQVKGIIEKLKALDEKYKRQRPETSENWHF